MAELTNFWMEFWFEPGNGYNLGVVRILIISYFMIFKLRDEAFDFQAWHKTYLIFKEEWQMPWLTRILKLKPPAKPETFRILFKAYYLFLLAAILGIGTQISCGISFILGVYLMSIRHGIRTHHTIMPLHFIMLALALGPSGHYLSVDSLIFDFEPFPEGYNWTIKFIQVLFSIIVFATGYAKLKRIFKKEVFWKKGHLASLLRLHDFPFFFVRPVVSISRVMKKYPLLELMSSAGTVIIEIIFPIVLFIPVTASILVPSFVGMIIGFRIFIGARFDFFSICLIATFTPWSEIATYMKSIKII
jgi:hypothetical protein